MWQSAIGRVRAAGMLEGVSYLLLLGVAMPLKYAADFPLAVTIAGWIHGIMFVILCYQLSTAKDELGWSHGKAARVWIAALLPFGPFVIDGWLRRQTDG